MPALKMAMLAIGGPAVGKASCFVGRSKQTVPLEAARAAKQHVLGSGDTYLAVYRHRRLPLASLCRSLTRLSVPRSTLLTAKPSLLFGALANDAPSSSHQTLRRRRKFPLRAPRKRRLPPMFTSAGGEEGLISPTRYLIFINLSFFGRQALKWESWQPGQSVMSLPFLEFLPPGGAIPEVTAR